MPGAGLRPRGGDAPPALDDASLLRRALEVEREPGGPGDRHLAEPRLSLDEDRFAALADRVAAVYHNGAMLDFILPFERLELRQRRRHAGGRRARASLSRARLVHVILGGVLPEGHLRGPAGLAEVAVGEGGRTLIPCGYTEIKRPPRRWSRRRSVRACRGIIARPSVVAGSSRSGAWNLDDAMCRIIKVHPGGAAPEIEWWPDLVPVDFVAEVIVALGERAKVDGLDLPRHERGAGALCVIVEVARVAGGTTSIGLGTMRARAPSRARGGERAGSAGRRGSARRAPSSTSATTDPS